MTNLSLIIASMAAVVAGFINAIAGGGTLLTFPTLIALGIAPITANITNTIALVPGLIGGMWAQRKDFITQRKRILLLLPFSVTGGLLGGYLLLHTSEKLFSNLVPYLILLATLILILQVPIKKWLVKRNPERIKSQKTRLFIALLILISATYGGYFGAGLGVILMAVLGLTFDNSLIVINVLKQAISFSINISASIYFLFSDKINWWLALPMAASAILGGFLGGKVVTKLNPNILRWIIVTVGLTVGTYYLLK